MKTPRISSFKRGFTLLELMVAMAVTAIIVTVLVSVTSIAVDTWNRSRSELRASRQAKAMVDVMARDFEGLIIRRGNTNEWMSAQTDVPGASSNASKLIFFTAASDRYDGAIGGASDKGGDVSCVGYQLAYKDPIGGGTTSNQTFVLNRHLVDPNKTFTDLLGKSDLVTAFNGYNTELAKVENFVCENVFQFTITFRVAPASGTTPIQLVTIGPSASTQTFSMKGTGIETTPADTSLASGRITGVEISLTVLSDSGMDAIRRNPALAANAGFLAKNSYNYSKLVQLPSM